MNIVSYHFNRSVNGCNLIPYSHNDIRLDLKLLKVLYIAKFTKFMRYFNEIK